MPFGKAGTLKNIVCDKVRPVAEHRNQKQYNNHRDHRCDHEVPPISHTRSVQLILPRACAPISRSSRTFRVEITKQSAASQAARHALSFPPRIYLSHVVLSKTPRLHPRATTRVGPFATSWRTFSTS